MRLTAVVSEGAILGLLGVDGLERGVALPPTGEAVLLVIADEFTSFEAAEVFCNFLVVA